MCDERWIATQHLQTRNLARTPTCFRSPAVRPAVSSALSLSFSLCRCQDQQVRSHGERTDRDSLFECDAPHFFNFADAERAMQQRDTLAFFGLAPPTAADADAADVRSPPLRARRTRRASTSRSPTIAATRTERAKLSAAKSKSSAPKSAAERAREAAEAQEALAREVAAHNQALRQRQLDEFRQRKQAAKARRRAGGPSTVGTANTGGTAAGAAGASTAAVRASTAGASAAERSITPDVGVRLRPRALGVGALRITPTLSGPSSRPGSKNSSASKATTTPRSGRRRPASKSNSVDKPAAPKRRVTPTSNSGAAAKKRRPGETRKASMLRFVAQ